jgi:hypothetical protein
VRPAQGPWQSRRNPGSAEARELGRRPGLQPSCDHRPCHPAPAGCRTTRGLTRSWSSMTVDRRAIGSSRGDGRAGARRPPCLVGDSCRHSGDSPKSSGFTRTTRPPLVPPVVVIREFESRAVAEGFEKLLARPEMPPAVSLADQRPTLARQRIVETGQSNG